MTGMRFSIHVIPDEIRGHWRVVALAIQEGKDNGNRMRFLHAENTSDAFIEEHISECVKKIKMAMEASHA